MGNSGNKSDGVFAREKVTKTIMHAAGWKEGTFNSEAVGLDSVFFYVSDIESGWVWCCSVPRENFLSAKVVFDSESMEQCCGVCNELISKHANGGALSQEEDRDLAVSLTGYVCKTRVYEATKNATIANHFFVARYGRKNIIRPFAVGGPAKYPLPVPQVEDAFKRIHELDRLNHPEWM